MLLLDEPTNNLDAHGLALMADFVTGHEGPVLVASHDRAFLDRVATRVVELDLAQQRVGHYAGGWSDYVAARDLERRQAREAFEEYAGARDQLVAQARQRADWAAKGRRNVAQRRRARQAHPREVQGPRRPAGRQGGPASGSPPTAWRRWRSRARSGSCATRSPPGRRPPTSSGPSTGSRSTRGDFHLGPLDLTVARGDRLALAGDNGTGKSTLLAALLGDLPVSAGRVTRGSRVRVGVVDQPRSLLETDSPVVDVVRAELTAPDGSAPDRGEVRTLLAKFGLGSEHVDRPARSLSLGERTRAMLAIFQAREVNVLVLDEPTNHLDVPAIEQLESALADFPGTLVVVSHDRAFLDRVGIDRTLDLGTTGRLTRSTRMARPADRSDRPRPDSRRRAARRVAP